MKKSANNSVLSTSKMNSCASILLSALSLTVLWNLGQALSYALTVRDFLPTSCSLTRTEVGPGVKFSEVSSVSADCPYRAEILNGELSGHPDFNMISGAGSIPGGFYDEHKISGSNGYLLPNSGSTAASTGNVFFESTVGEYTEIASSGLPKPSYCTSNTFAGFDGEVRCGYFERTSSSGQVIKSFSTVCFFGL